MSTDVSVDDDVDATAEVVMLHLNEVYCPTWHSHTLTSQMPCRPHQASRPMTPVWSPCPMLPAVSPAAWRRCFPVQAIKFIDEGEEDQLPLPTRCEVARRTGLMPVPNSVVRRRRRCSPCHLCTGLTLSMSYASRWQNTSRASFMWSRMVKYDDISCEPSRRWNSFMIVWIIMVSAHLLFGEKMHQWHLFEKYLPINCIFKIKKMLILIIRSRLMKFF